MAFFIRGNIDMDITEVYTCIVCGYT
uniref:Uncharacterized protein n=1 Tax=Anguilla anguilla TaxID=7936 RepID=A0A0E9XPF8_ANGAN